MITVGQHRLLDRRWLMLAFLFFALTVLVTLMFLMHAGMLPSGIFQHGPTAIMHRHGAMAVSADYLNRH